ncbi:MAG: histidine phosphatase family protein [Patescibacteria group bacterium]|nr:histidine phosphatase family protein [Patescibacteria group bacterium]
MGLFPTIFMSIKLTYFVHGTTEDNEKEISSGWSDAKLSILGVKQCLELKDKIKGRKFDVVFCSDLDRAASSAKLIFEDRIKIFTDKRLRECNYGDYNGRASSIVEPLQEKFITENFPDGESYEDVRKRIEDFIVFLKKNYDGKNIAIVGHKAPQLALEVILNKKAWAQAFADDWRKNKAWQPGWDYFIE